MSICLAIDTSSFIMGVALTDHGKTVAELTTNLKKNHSLRLMPAIEQMMKEADISPRELEKIVVAKGPGSYTGVRIGVTTAKTMAWSLGIPVVGVSSLAVLAQAGRFFHGVIVPLMDARRGQVYTGSYIAQGMEVRQQGEDRLVLLTDWLDWLHEQQQDVLFIGQDVALHRETIVERLGERACFMPGAAQLPRPAELARLGDDLQGVPSPHALVPDYLQLAEAEAKWQKAQTEKGPTT
ncbi:tRNA (adenosine(37)-N6)-threonylcarbamoyltransferase complex dimerization subunit type 1 TsaB [Alkalihalobacillus oceani]|uniref:tRNA (adenosine(37)-N6)-threonylcarbamoyltransferase complex dimerization subunit type 1 TsaB n=1 Tax=Halalkalibacter oceani TaxID=1653776 RepID=UPI002040F286|nr:tRNA (adenosine(37)-N6)-threonylcarbamoyltransferase complex dimerization subunit type 1 TsaB [Halalkalibacter oceani]MCM3761071.1 tRNA (adenosine(37)-N6)-threonylcarbamoyltransferase complex dimerization subunit type 1 TsaB [Halalkalibacter oceani]